MRRLPRYVHKERTRHGRLAFYFRPGKRGPRIRLPDNPHSPEFIAAYKAALRASPIEDVRDMPITAVELRKQRTEKIIRRALNAARIRSATKGVPFDLDLDFLLTLAQEQDFRCAITGIEFFAHNDTKSRIDPYTPSIDRIIPALGYTKGNVRLLIFAVNAMLLDWGEPLFIRIANSYRYWNHWNRRTKNDQYCPPPQFLPLTPQK